MKIHKRHTKHLFLTIFIAFLGFAFFLFLGNIYYEKIHPTTNQVQLGVTFSSTYSKYLLGDWKKAYLQILDNLKAKHLRIPAYWESIEPKPDQWNFDDVDYMLEEAQKRDVKIILAVGMKLPRWPECHTPDWVKALTVQERQQKTLIYIEKVIERYKNHPEITSWEIENEPLLDFGSQLCDNPDRDFLRTEVALAKNIDPTRPIILTDSGELRMWITPMQLSDIFGTTLYRSVYNPLFGYFYYPLPPAFYNFKAKLIKAIFAPNNQKTIIIELQTEPWSPQGVPSAPIDKQIQVFTIQDFKNNINYAKRTGFTDVYLWGVEWWYYMAENGHPEYLEYAKTLFNQ